MYVFVTPTMPFTDPVKNLRINAVEYVVENPKEQKHIPVSSKPVNKTGRRPNRSDKDPQQYENKNCPSMKDATRYPA
jgi:hypothetical protein